MRRNGIALLAAVAMVAPTTPAYGGGTGTWLRNYMTSYTAHAGIPAWARKYIMNCSGCHYPAAPRLNATGIRFRWAGYRMPEEMGEKVDVSQVSNYLAVRGRMRYEYSKTESQPVSTSAFTFNDATVFYAGALGRNFGAFTELEREPSGEVELQANVVGVWGKERSYRGFRAGQMHWLLRDGVAGFDRPTVNTYGSIATVDYLLESVSAAAVMLAGLGRLVQDLLLWCTTEFGYLRLADGFVQGSSIMPQKRNPVALEHARAIGSKALGQAQAITIAVHNTPFGDIVDTEDDLQPLVASMFRDALRTVTLVDAAMRTAEFDVARLEAHRLPVDLAVHRDEEGNSDRESPVLPLVGRHPILGHGGTRPRPRTSASG